MHVLLHPLFIAAIYITVATISYDRRRRCQKNVGGAAAHSSNLNTTGFPEILVWEFLVALVDPPPNSFPWLRQWSKVTLDSAAAGIEPAIQSQVQLATEPQQ